LNNWTAASKNPKPFESNFKRKLLSVAPWSKRFIKWAVPIHPRLPAAKPERAALISLPRRIRGVLS